jgi:hypothetical protein
MGPVSMDKKRILETLPDEMRAKFSVLIQSAHAARQEATHEDAKAENKYDTGTIEAGYLAGAQAERVAQLQATISFFERLEKVYPVRVEPNENNLK